MSSSDSSDDEQPHQPSADNSASNPKPLAPQIGSQPSNGKVSGCSRSQVRRIDSSSSVGSVGMGATRPSVPRFDPEAPAKLLPAGDAPASHVYDCVVYIFYCQTHDCVALSSTERTRVVWFPFLPLEEGFTYKKAASNGIATFLGRRRSENDQDEAYQVPKYTTQFVHMLHVQLPTDRHFVRLASFVQVEGNNEKFPCCQPTVHLNWVQSYDIIQDQVESLWGPEVKQFLNLLIRPEPIWMEEFSKTDALRLLSPENAQPYQLKLLSSCKVNQETVQALFEDYIEHCFPATFMCLESLKAYLLKYGFNSKDARFIWICKAMAFKHPGQGYLDFDEFLLGILCMEPTTEHNEARMRMLFRYYDIDHDEKLSMEEFVGLMKDLTPKAKDEEIREMVLKATDSLKIGSTNDKLTFDAFNKAASSGKLSRQGLNQLIRSPKPIIPAVLSNAKKRALSLFSPGNADPSKREVKREGRGICNGCRAQDVDFCLHTVYLDTAGMCQKPMRIKNVEPPTDKKMTPMRYSCEYVFSVESIFRSFIDSVRDVFCHGGSGLMACGPEEAQQLAGHVSYLTDTVSELLASEERLIRTNAPAVVIGDINGNLSNLMALERSLWQSVPVLHANLIFLGNYIGQCKWNVETVCYLLSLKVTNPNKVFLLRGVNETREENRVFLLAECVRKYGSDTGKTIWQTLNEALDRLPFAAVIDESILCVHSGIPRASGSLITKFFELHECIHNVEKESPLAYELISNVPRDIEQTEPSESSQKNNSRQSEFTATHFGSFLKTNNLTHLIRGHDAPPTGYQMLFGGRCITLSAANADPVVAFVDCSNETIRLVRVQVENTDSSSSQHSE